MMIQLRSWSGASDLGSEEKLLLTQLRVNKDIISPNLHVAESNAKEIEEGLRGFEETQEGAGSFHQADSTYNIVDNSLLGSPKAAGHGNHMKENDDMVTSGYTQDGTPISLPSFHRSPTSSSISKTSSSSFSLYSSCVSGDDLRGEGSHRGILTTLMCTEQVTYSYIKKGDVGNGEAIAIEPIGNSLNEWDPERFLETLGVHLVDSRGQGLRVVVRLDRLGLQIKVKIRGYGNL